MAANQWIVKYDDFLYFLVLLEDEFMVLEQQDFTIEKTTGPKVFTLVIFK